MKGIFYHDDDHHSVFQLMVRLQVGVQEGADDEELLLSTAGGRILRTPVSSIRASSRAARGGLLSKLQEGDAVQAVTILQASEG